MSTTQPKNHQRSGECHLATGRRARGANQRFATALAALRDTTSIPKGAASLAQELLAVVIARHHAGLTEIDAQFGTMATALLSAQASGMPRAEFVAWLHHTADEIVK